MQRLGMKYKINTKLETINKYETANINKFILFIQNSIMKHYFIFPYTYLYTCLLSAISDRP